MITFGGLFEHFQILFEFLLGKKRRPVNALQLRLCLVPAPIRPGYGKKFEGLDVSRVIDMGTFT